MRSPTQFSIKLLKERGYLIDIAESYNAFTKRRHDLFNFIDIAALHPLERGVLGVQTTTGSNVSARIKKAEALPGYWMWLRCQNEVEFHGWRKILKKRGGKQKIWLPIIKRVSCPDLLL